MGIESNVLDANAKKADRDLVLACEVAFEHQISLVNDKDRMDVGSGRSEPIRHGPQGFTINKLVAVVGGYSALLGAPPWRRATSYRHRRGEARERVKGRTAKKRGELTTSQNDSPGRWNPSLALERLYTVRTIGRQPTSSQRAGEPSLSQNGIAGRLRKTAVTRFARAVVEAVPEAGGRRR